MIEEQKFYWTLLDTLKDGVYFANKQRKITYWNKAAEAITGYKNNEMLGRFCGDNLLIHIDEEGNSLCKGPCPLTRTMDTGEAYEEKIYLHHKDGHRVPVFVRTTPVYGSNDEIIGAVEIFTDLSAREALTNIRALDEPDLLSSLSGLPTRQCLEMNLKLKFFEWEEFQHVFGVFHIKINGFEEVKNTIGQEAAEEVVKTLSQTLIHNITPGDMIGEWGEGEFLGVAGYGDEARLSFTANHYRHLLENTELSHISKADAAVSISFSVGTALVREGDTIEKLLERAWAAPTP
ncbi:MAG: diguanylate cyclase [Candidatus Aminicenantes bacterium]|nr:diguanylate cyclase [Candidatus Aminicenantes bacterium]NIM78286.1 diguanylate cyclase [Candidatus Aminicenantes bacterium]NIN19712.1 diguanylate cyclase [Candidatus Aminicenantes bacterium]NIN43594.1 diguanylate cyclase [Candidatus Aminicenantes bacterium]NIN86339.1 diguanylate cyclase [Candidatus Aminicenantes bacterium]